MNKERISKNEKRLNKILINIRNMESVIADFTNNKKDLALLNKYYGSKSWFRDKEDFESSKIKDIEAGVLSEDAVWNLNEDIKYLIEEMEKIIKSYK